MAIKSKHWNGDKKTPIKKTSNTTPKDQKGFQVPKKGDLFVVKAKGVEWKVIKATSNWEITVVFGDKEEIILAGNLWDQIDQKKWYYKPTKAKYDWVALKQEFFESDFIEARSFIQHKYSRDTADSGQVQKQITWWADEKKKIQEEMKQKALEDFKSNLKQRWEHVFDVLDQAHVKGLMDLANMILDQWQQRKMKIVRKYRDPETKEVTSSEIVEIDDISPTLHQADMISILKHIKLEKWEPTDIVENWSKAKAWLLEMKQKKQQEKSK